jgi:hypothetical protein
MVTHEIRLDIARLEVKKWERIAQRYRVCGNEPPPFVVDKLSEVQKKLSDLQLPKQGRLI